MGHWKWFWFLPGQETSDVVKLWWSITYTSTCTETRSLCNQTSLRRTINKSLIQWIFHRIWCTLKSSKIHAETFTDDSWVQRMRERVLVVLHIHYCCYFCPVMCSVPLIFLYWFAVEIRNVLVSFHTCVRWQFVVRFIFCQLFYESLTVRVKKVTATILPIEHYTKNLIFFIMFSLFCFI